MENYYAGAMTMFFANEISVPFEGTEDVINAYPSWSLVILNGKTNQRSFGHLHVMSPRW